MHIFDKLSELLVTDSAEEYTVTPMLVSTAE